VLHSQLATRSLGCSTRSLEWKRFRVGIQELEKGRGGRSIAWWDSFKERQNVLGRTEHKIKLWLHTLDFVLTCEKC